MGIRVSQKRGPSSVVSRELRGASPTSVVVRSEDSNLAARSFENVRSHPAERPVSAGCDFCFTGGAIRHSGRREHRILSSHSQNDSAPGEHSMSGLRVWLGAVVVLALSVAADLSTGAPGRSKRPGAGSMPTSVISRRMNSRAAASVPTDSTRPPTLSKASSRKPDSTSPASTAAPFRSSTW